MKTDDQLIEAGQALLDTLDLTFPKEDGRPTIGQLERMLEAPGGKVEIKPDSSIHTAPREEIEAFRAALAKARGET